MDSHEQKYVFQVQAAPIVCDWARHCLVPDRQYPTAEISSIYFDTAAGRAYEEKRSSEYLKKKLRLRWYAGDAADGGKLRPCFLEIKQKTGAKRRKDRIGLSLEPRYLCNPCEHREELRRLPEIRVFEKLWGGESLEPVSLIRYRRHRYLDIDTGARIAVDTGIVGRSLLPAALHDRLAVSLDVGVLEIKGSARDLPPQLCAISGYLVRESFSKFARCREHLSQPFARRM